jgi:uncharacterized protein YdhG (YjbR/CyaY superfamily)
MARKSAPKAGTHEPKDPNAAKAARAAKEAASKKTWGAQPAAPSADDYIAESDEKHRDGLVELRALIRETVPEATEAIQWGFPAYDLNGPLCGFASRSNYIAFYVMNQQVVDAHKVELKHLDVDKGCIRAKRIRDMPIEVFRTMLKEAAAKSAEN